MIAIVEEHYTIADYEQWEGDWELIAGRAYAMAPAPVNKHQWRVGKVIFLLNSKLRKCKECFVLGEAEYRVSEDTVLRPDVALICGELGKYIVTAPLLIVEIISESTKLRDEITKKSIYQKEGVFYYILVYPDGSVKIFDLKEEKEINTFELKTPCVKIAIKKEEISEET